MKKLAIVLLVLVVASGAGWLAMRERPMPPAATASSPSPLPQPQHSAVEWWLQRDPELEEALSRAQARVKKFVRDEESPIRNAALLEVQGSGEFARQRRLEEKMYRDYQAPPRIPWENWDVYGIDRDLYITPKDPPPRPGG